MFKKYMCLVLCILMALGTMSTTALAANVVVDGLTATHVTFTDATGGAITKLPATASKVKANVNVSNVSTTDAPVILWVGKYESDVLTDVAVTRQVISAGATDVAVSVTMDGVERNEIRETADGPTIDLTTLKAYVWTGMVGGKALAAPACFPSKSTDVAYATLDGEVWKDFRNDVTEYTITLGADETVPTLGMVAKDNATSITVPALTKGANTITVVGADSATNTKSYKVNLNFSILAKKNGEVWADFNETTHSYDFVLSATEAVPTFSFEPVGDSVAVVTQPATWVEGYNTVTIDRNGYVEEYKIGIEYPLIATKDGETWEEFDSNTFKYSFNLSRTEYPPQISFAASKPDSSITITQPEAYSEGDNVVKVTRANGHERTYTLSLDYASPSVEIIDAGDSGATYLHTFFTGGSGLATDRMNWVAGGRGAGTLGMRYFTVGWRESKHQTWNKNNKVSFKFRANAGGTMYVVTNGAYTNYTEAGWTKLSTGLFAMPTIDGTTHTTATLPFEYVAPDDNGQNMSLVWYQNAATRSYPATMGVCFKLRFEAGQLVEVPTTNSAGDVNMIPLVKWDVPQPAVMDNAKLNGIQYEKGENNYVSISGFDPDVTEYDVRLDAGVTSVVVKAATAENSAAIESFGSTDTSIVSDYGIIPLVGGVGKAEIKVVAPDGITTKTYVVNFKTKKANSELPNKIYNLYTSRESGVYTENGGYFSASDRTNGNISCAGIEDNLDADSYWYSDRTNKVGNTAATYAGATYIRVPKNDMNKRYTWSYGGSETTLVTGWGYRYYEDADWVDPTTGVNTLYSFNVSSDATVYYLSSNSSLKWTNGTSTGWTANSNNGVFYKNVKAGEKVNIPTLEWSDNWPAKGESVQQYFNSQVPAYMEENGFTTASQITGIPMFGGIYDPFKIIIVWKDPSASVSDDTSVKAIKLNDVAMEDYTDDNTNSIDVSLEKGTTSAKLQLETTDKNAAVTYYIDNVEQTTDYANVTSFPKTVKVKITSSDDSTDRVIMFSVDVEDEERVAALTGISYRLGDGDAVAVANFDKDTLSYEVTVDPTKAITVTATGDENSKVIAPADAVNIPFDTDLTKAVKTVTVKAKNGSAVKNYQVTFKADIKNNHVYSIDVSNVKQYYEGGSVGADWDKTQTYYTNGGFNGVKLYNTTAVAGTWYDGYYVDDTDVQGNGWEYVSVSNGIERGVSMTNKDKGLLINTTTTDNFEGQTIIRRARNESYGQSGTKWTWDTSENEWKSTSTNETRQAFYYDDFSGKDGAPYWYSFYISSPGTVYVDPLNLQDERWTTGEADGWTKSATSKINGRLVYYKSFDEAGIVNIPNAYGDLATRFNNENKNHFLHELGNYYIIWGACGETGITPTPPTPTENKAKLSAFTFTPNGGTAANVTGWTAADLGTKAYSVSVPSGTTSVAFAATAVSGATVTPAATTVDVSAGGTGTAAFTISDGTNISAFTVTITVETAPEPVGHQLTISYTADKAEALKATVTEAKGSEVNVGDEYSISSTNYEYVENGLALGDKVMVGRDNWRAVHISENLYGLSLIKVDLQELRDVGEASISRGSAGSDYERVMAPNQSAKDWFKGTEGTWFEITPNMNGTLYMLTNYEAPTWDTKYTRLDTNALPTEFDTSSNKNSPKDIPFDTVIRSRKHCLSVQQYSGSVGDQYTDDTKMELSGCVDNGHLGVYKNAFKVDFTANTKLPVSVPGNILNDGVVFLVEWEDTKIADPVLSTLKYSVDDGAETAVADFAAGTKKYTVDGLAESTTSVTVSATAPAGMTVTVTQPAFDADGEGVATILVESGAYKQETYEVTFKKASPAQTVLKADTIYNLTMNSGYYATGKHPAPPTADETWSAGTVKLGRDGELENYKIYNPNSEDRTGEYFCDYYVADGATDTHDQMFVVRNMVIPTMTDNSDGTDKYNDRQNNNGKKIDHNTSDYFKGATLISRRHSDASEVVSANWKIKDGNTIGKDEWASNKWERVTPYLKGATCEPYISGAFDGKDHNPYWMEFIVSSGATVFVTDPWNTGWINAPADWTKNSTSSVLLDGKTAFYYKHYNAGEKVQIPNWGLASSWDDTTLLFDPPIYVVVWDSAQPTGPEGAIEDGGEGLASL